MRRLPSCRAWTTSATASAVSATLGALETRVGHVVRSTSGVGDRLRLADARRAAAGGARARHPSRRLRPRPRFPSAPPRRRPALPRPRAFRGGGATRAASPPPRARRRRRRPRGDGARPRPNAPVGVGDPREPRRRSRPVLLLSRASRPPRLAVAAHNLERYCDALENRLLSSFESAERARDAEGARGGSNPRAIQRGESVARRFVATRAMFMSVESHAEIETLARRRRSTPRWRRRRKRTPPPSPRSTLYGAFSRERGTPPAPRRRRRGNSSRIIASPPRRSPRARRRTARRRGVGRRWYPRRRPRRRRRPRIRVDRSPRRFSRLRRRRGNRERAPREAPCAMTAAPPSPPPPPSPPHAATAATAATAAAATGRFPSVGALGELMTPSFHRLSSLGGGDRSGSSSTDPRQRGERRTGRGFSLGLGLDAFEAFPVGTRSSRISRLWRARSSWRANSARISPRVSTARLMSRRRRMDSSRNTVRGTPNSNARVSRD